MIERVQPRWPTPTGNTDGAPIARWHWPPDPGQIHAVGTLAQQMRIAG
jgi:hypothetical protein